MRHQIFEIIARIVKRQAYLRRDLTVEDGEMTLRDLILEPQQVELMSQSSIDGSIWLIIGSLEGWITDPFFPDAATFLEFEPDMTLNQVVSMVIKNLQAMPVEKIPDDNELQRLLDEALHDPVAINLRPVKKQIAEAERLLTEAEQQLELMRGANSSPGIEQPDWVRQISCPMPEAARQAVLAGLGEEAVNQAFLSGP